MESFCVCVSLAGWIVAAAWLFFSMRLLLFLRSRPSLVSARVEGRRADDPHVCVVVPARDEAGSVEACIRSLIAQDYPKLRIIAVDDRSSDNTGEIIGQLACESSHVEMVTVSALPQDWLGKNYANHVGASLARSQDCDYILFTDGDVLFDSRCVTLAVRYIQQQNLHQFCLLPGLMGGGLVERGMVSYFTLCYLLKCQPWQLQKRAKSNSFIGVGAFNLVERGAYDSVGGHESLRLEVADDYKLGKLFKRAGFSCGVAPSDDLVKIRWHKGLGGIVRGLEKNSFAGFDYSLLSVVMVIQAHLLGSIVPWIVVVAMMGIESMGWVVAIGVQVVALSWVCVTLRQSAALAVALPIYGATLAWAISRGVFLTWIRRGIYWRNTFYHLRDLKRGVV